VPAIAPFPFLAKVVESGEGGHPGFRTDFTFQIAEEAIQKSKIEWITVAGQRRTCTGFPHCHPSFRDLGDPRGSHIQFDIE
jgi:hypothetical protein